jgi:hypothetical protein
MHGEDAGVSALRLTSLALLVIVLGYLLLATPGVTEVALPGGGRLLLPRSLEGWNARAGQGDRLVTARTRLGLITLEVEQTPVPAGGDITGYIAQWHRQRFQELPDYYSRLSGEVKPFGDRPVPMGVAVFDGTYAGLPLRFLQQDAYMIHQGRYIRVSLRYPLALDGFYAPDQVFIARGIALVP